MVALLNVMREDMAPGAHRVGCGFHLWVAGNDGTEQLGAQRTTLLGPAEPTGVQGSHGHAMPVLFFYR